MASVAETIKYGDANITSAVREFWNSELQDKLYAQSLSRNLPRSVQVVARYEQGVDKTYNWTRSKGITTTSSTRYDVANTDLEMNQVEYGTEEYSVTADHFAGFVSEKVDILRDQEGFVVPNIIDSLARDLAEKENAIFTALLDTTTNVAVNGAAGDDDVAATLQNLRNGVTSIKNSLGQCNYMLMNHNMVSQFADEMGDASVIGDNGFLRDNTVGRLYGANVIESTRIPDDTVYYLGNDAVILFERMPYTLTNGRDNITDLYVKFAVEARFGMGFNRDEMVVKSIYNGN